MSGKVLEHGDLVDFRHRLQISVDHECTKKKLKITTSNIFIMKFVGLIT